MLQALQEMTSMLFFVKIVKIVKQHGLTSEDDFYNPKSEKVGTVWKTQIKKESSDF